MRRRKRPSRWRLAGGIEGLEARDLPSVAAIYLARAGAARSDSSAGVPTPHERARRAFAAWFSGSYVLGPGRTTDQASQVFLRGGGNANQFLHGNLQMALFTPADPTQPFSGEAALIVKNVANTGNLLALTLRGDPEPNARGLPTRLTWTVDDGSSGGAYSGAVGQGTTQIIYFSGNKLPSRATGAGRFGVIFRGEVATTGVFNTTFSQR